MDEGIKANEAIFYVEDGPMFEGFISSSGDSAEYYLQDVGVVQLIEWLNKQEGKSLYFERDVIKGGRPRSRHPPG